MKMTTRIITVAALIAASGLALHVARAQLPGIKRTDLQRHDLSVPGREVVQVRVDFAPGVAFGKHSHPGEEIVYVVEGSLMLDVQGVGPKNYSAGDGFQVPTGMAHGGKIGDKPSVLIAVYVVEKGKPLTSPAP